MKIKINKINSQIRSNKAGNKITGNKITSNKTISNKIIGNKIMLKFILNKIFVFSIIVLMIGTVFQTAYALSITGEKAEDIKAHSAKVSWNTDEDANSTVRVNNNDFSNSVLKKAHEINVFGLSPNTQYTADIISSNSSETKQTQITFSTTSPVNTATSTTLNYSLSVSDSVDTAPLTNVKTLTVSGTAPSNTSIRIFVNSDSIASPASETGKALIIPDDEGNVKATVSLSTTPFKSIIGLNELRIEIEEQGKPKREIKKYLRVDKIPPALRLGALPLITNRQSINIQGVIDEKSSINLTYILGNITRTEQITVSSDLKIDHTLKLPQDGAYNIEIVAVDEAGNSFTQKQSITVDTVPCTLQDIKHREELEKEVQHFSLISIAGRTSEPGCQIVLINIGAEKQLNINFTDLDDYLSRDLRTRTDYEVGLGGLIVGKSKKIKSDTKGQFETQLALQQNRLEADDPRRAAPIRSSERRDERRDVESPNIIHDNNIKIYVIDAAGNVEEDILPVKYQPGSLFWKLGRVQVLPNTVYSNNLFADRSRGVEISLMFDLHYLGPSPSLLKNPQVTVSLDGSKLDNKHISVGETFSYFKPEENKVFVLTKLIIRPNANTVKELEAVLGGIELPSLGSGLQVDFGLESIVSFNIGDEFYTNEKVFIQHAVGVETPFDYTKYLTPEMIADMLDEIDNWIDFLAKAVDVAEKATLALTAGCAAMTIGTIITGPEGGFFSLKNTYELCDRVWCPSIPPDCQNVKKIAFDENNVKYVFNEQQGKFFPEGKDAGALDKAPSNVAFEQLDNQTTTTYKWVAGNDAKDRDGRRICPDGMNAIEVRSFGKQQGTLILGGETTTIASGVRYECTYKNEQDYKSSDARSASVGCYNDQAPQYDQSKCRPWSADSVNDDGEVNTYDDIFISSKCGCVSGVRGHLSNFLRISEGFKKCLQQAQLGEVRGGYCERLFAQFACDIVSWGVQKLVSGVEKEGWTGHIGQEEARTIRQNFNTVQTNLQARYGGIIQNRFGLSSDQLVHKACIGAITGDWSDLENIFRQAGRIPVEPVIGPMQPESRFTSWNPFTGEAAINYYLTLGILSGGQEVTGTIKIMCDKNFPGGEYCPGDRPVLIYEESLYIPPDGSVQRNLFYEDQRAKYWANVAILDLSYKVGAEIKHYSKKDQIRKLNSFIAECSFQVVPPTIVCDTLLGGPAAAEFKSASTSPKVQTYYPENDVFIRLDTGKMDPSRLAGGEGEITDLYYVYELKEPNGRITSNKDSAELRKWRVSLEDPRETQVFKLKSFSGGISAKERKGWFAVQRDLSSATFTLVRGEIINIKALGGNNLDPRPIENISLWDAGGNLETECQMSVPGEVDCTNPREKDFTAARISYNILSLEGDTVAKLVFTKGPPSFKKELDIGGPEFQSVEIASQAGQYVMNITLYHDKDRNGIINQKDSTVPFGVDKVQGKSLDFTFNHRVPPGCKESPKVEILYPKENVIITQDLKTGFDPQGGIIFTRWDDCNDFKSFALFDSKSFDASQEELRKKAIEKGSPLTEAEIKEILARFAIEYNEFPSSLEDGIFFMGSGKSLVYNYRAEESFDLILRVEDFAGNIGEDRVRLTKVGQEGILTASPSDYQSCSQQGGHCTLSCAPEERNLGSCGNGRCCG